jgi:hypothetical protein
LGGDLALNFGITRKPHGLIQGFRRRNRNAADFKRESACHVRQHAEFLVHSKEDGTVFMDLASRIDPSRRFRVGVRHLSSTAARHESTSSLNKSGSFTAAEQEARESKRRLWGDVNPIPPWERRREKLQTSRNVVRTTRTVGRIAGLETPRTIGVWRGRLNDAGDAIHPAWQFSGRR